MRSLLILSLFFGVLSHSAISFASPGASEGPPIPEAWQQESETVRNRHSNPSMTNASFTDRSRSAGRTLKIVGWSIFGSAFVGSAILGGALVADGLTEGALLFIPVAGPAVLSGRAFASDANNTGTDSDGWGSLAGSFLLIPTLVQTAGAALLTVGHIKAYKARRTARLDRFSLAVAPIQDGSGARAGFGMRF